MTADHAGQTGGEREWCCDHDDTWHYTPVGLGSFGRLCAHRDCKTAGHPSGPVPVAGQAAREAAVEAVARWLYEAWGAGLDWDDGAGWQASWRSSARTLLSLPEVAALSAAPGQEPLVEWPCPNCGATTRARMADHPGQEQGR